MCRLHANLYLARSEKITRGNGFSSYSSAPGHAKGIFLFDTGMQGMATKIWWETNDDLNAYHTPSKINKLDFIILYNSFQQFIFVIEEYDRYVV